MSVVDLRTSQAGMIIPSGRASVSGYLLCDGSAVSRTTYADLFTAIGTTFGVGDGSTTFNIPDFVGAVPRGAGTSTGYTQNVTVTLGSKDDDSFQRWQLGATVGADDYYGFGSTPGQGNAPATSSTEIRVRAATGEQGSTEGLVAFSDGTNGTPRTGNETKMKNVGVNYFIKF